MSKKVFILILFILHFPLVHAGTIDDDVRANLASSFLQKNKICIGKMDNRTTDSGRLVFLGLDMRDTTDSEGWRPNRIYYHNLKNDQCSILIETQDLVTLTGDNYRMRNVIEICSDRSASRIGFNVQRLVKDPEAVNCGSEIIVYDRIRKKIILNKFDNRYHTDLNISDDGRYLAYYSHPDTYLRMNNAWNTPRIKMYQAEIVDLDSSTTTILAPECTDFPLFKAGFHWSADSKYLYFMQYKPVGGKNVQTIFRWSRDGQVKTFPLIGDRGHLLMFRILRNNKILCASPTEIYLLNEDLTFDRTFHRANNLLGVRFIGDKLYAGEDDVHAEEKQIDIPQ